MNQQQLAAHQVHDFDQHHPGRCFADAEVSLSIEQAYALQFQVALLREQRRSDC